VGLKALLLQIAFAEPTFPWAQPEALLVCVGWRLCLGRIPPLAPIFEELEK